MGGSYRSESERPAACQAAIRVRLERPPTGSRGAAALREEDSLPAAVSAAPKKDRLMRTELCEQFGIDLPIFAFSHCRDVVAAVSKAGGLGVLGAVGFSPEQLEIELRWLDEHIGDRPYGVDIVIPGKYEGMGEIDPAKL